MQQIYTRDILKNFSRTQLHEICDKLCIAHRRSNEDCINDILAKQPHLVAQVQPLAQQELEQYIEAQAEAIAPEQQRMKNNCQGYQDAIAGLGMQSSDPCYRLGCERGLRDVSPTPKEDTGSQAIVFEKVGSTVHGGLWEANVNGTVVRIAAVNNGYKTNLTGDILLVDFGIAVKESLLAVARLAPKEDPSFEIYATDEPEVYAVYSHKPGQETKRYEVNLAINSCTCPHYEHRHEQEGFRDKHIEAVKLAIAIHTALPQEREMLLDKPFDELTDSDWQVLNQLVAA
ncbi:hypothetical protein [Nostoc sp. FACHB-110]|uniref:hypothetical protein n=1 Tax=Nostoc sp. FACHB-110 TaxID=2692834 RepID=UPI001682FF2E|nr:hypothetical protein [Nostoc sp. FACHB-110]MBD2437398.1 hypothetical protein [Nostoc sp. FACHB-110]